MTPIRGLHLMLAGVGLIAASGCVSYPISKQARAEAMATRDISFLAISQNPGAYQGRTVIWGGKILQTVNETNGGSAYVLQAPLDHQEQPGSTKLSQGRFIVRTSGFLDPEVYQPGARITIAGQLSGTETQNVGNRRYAYPVVTLREVYFWAPETAVYVTPYRRGWGWNAPYGPYYGGFYDYYYPGYPLGFDRDWEWRFNHWAREREEREHGRR